jgi:hypothetical protein
VQPGRHRDPRDLAPFELVAGGRSPRPATQPLLLAMTEHLEEQAQGLGHTAVLVAAFDRDRHVTDLLRARYARLGAELAFCAVMGRDVPPDLAPGVHGGLAGDPARGEWTIAVVGPHYASALVAHQRSMAGPDGEPVYDYVLTYDRGVATAVAASLTARVTS